MSDCDQIYRRSSIAAVPYVCPGNGVGSIQNSPFMNVEHQRIKEKHRILASTGCSKDFCQAGRAIRTDEPRVGEDRSLHIVCQEAAGFLRVL